MDVQFNALEVLAHLQGAWVSSLTPALVLIAVLVRALRDEDDDFDF